MTEIGRDTNPKGATTRFINNGHSDKLTKKGAIARARFSNLR